MARNPDLEPHLQVYRDGLLLDLDVLIDALENIEEPDHEAASTADVTAEARSATVEQRHRAIRALRRVSTILSRGMAARVWTDNEAGELLTSMLLGQADPEDFARLITSVEVRAGQVGVTIQADGSYLLRATDFNLEDAPWGTLFAQFCQGLTLEIAYDTDAGLLRATAAHLGPYDGIVHLEPATVTADDPMFSDQRYHEDGVTTILNASMVRDMLEARDR